MTINKGFNGCYIKITCDNDECLSFHEIKTTFDPELYFDSKVGEMFKKCPCCDSPNIIVEIDKDY